MNNRMLAHLEKIIAINPIPEADKIEVATVLGWKCVVKKDQFKVGDLAVYIEIDSIVPKIPYFEFMNERNYRVKTIKLRKQISQGLLISWSDLITFTNIKQGLWKEGSDFTELLGITKYESLSDKEQNYIPKKKHNFVIKYLTRYQWFRKLFKMKSKSFPDWISKTDETRIQNLPKVFNNNKNTIFYISEKLEGQSGTFWYKHKVFPEFGICSRSVRKSELDNSNWSKIAKKLDIKNKLKKLNFDLCIQGEIIGPSIQENIYNLKELDFYVFNMFNIKTKTYLELNTIEKICKDLDLKIVPILDRNFKLPETMDELIYQSNNKSVLYNTRREGLVIRTYDQSISFKVVSPEYLLNKKDIEYKDIEYNE